MPRLKPPAAKRTLATAWRCRYSHGLIRRLIPVRDRERVVLSSGACIGMPPAACGADCPVGYQNDIILMGGSSRTAPSSALHDRLQYQLNHRPAGTLPRPWWAGGVTRRGRAAGVLPGAGGWAVAVQHLGLAGVPCGGGAVRVQDQGPALLVD